MAVSFISYVRHCVCGTSKLKATTTGHIYNIRIEKDMDNGTLVAKGDYISPELYKPNLTVTGFSGVILDKAANGSWYVEVREPGDALLLCNPELIYEQYTTQTQHPSNFYNASGDTVRGFELHVGDIFELSNEGFVGEAAKGSTVTVDSGTNKLAVA